VQTESLTTCCCLSQVRFEHDLASQRITEWETSYLDYKMLKAVLKQCLAKKDDTEFFAAIQTELGKVNNFYMQKMKDFEVQIAKNMSADGQADVSLREMEMNVIQRQLGHMQSYIWLNTQGFENIMKKYDKRMELRSTGNEKSPEFIETLKTQPFRSTSLESVLDMAKLARRQIVRSSMTVQNMKLLSGSGNPQLAQEIAGRLGVPLTRALVGRFNDGEINIQVRDPTTYYWGDSPLGRDPTTNYWGDSLLGRDPTPH
jgi:SPX domain protein involved in polyphosphate accumulation